MKKKLLIALVALLVAAFTLGMTAAFADDQKPWAPADSNVTLTGGSEKVAVLREKPASPTKLPTKIR